MEVNFIDLQKQYAGKSYNMDLMGIVKSCKFVGSEAFEKKFANYHGSKYCVGVASGTDALWLSLLALGIGPGDEVIVPAQTFIATVFAVSHTGATPVFVDVDPYLYIMRPADLKHAITDKTKAVIPVHLYGQPCDMSSIKGLARVHNIKVIEDCAQATGASLFDQKVGTWGHVGCFSFYPTKNLGGLGQGGAVITDMEFLATRIRELGNVGRTDGSWYDYSHIGFNSRLDAINAKFMEINLDSLDQWNDRRISIANQYAKELENVDEVTTAPEPNRNVRPVYHLYEIQVEDGHVRDELQKYLEEKGIKTGLYYPIPCHKQPMYKDIEAECPNTEKLADTLLTLPMHPYLTEEEASYVCDSIKNYFKAKVI